MQMLSDRLIRDLGIPVVVFEGDQSDPDFYSENRANYAIEGLLEAIASDKKRRAAVGA
jgi:hypothetical protein